ncbi:PREDICTED: uncharacterized protein LOC105152775 [Acromyrmex echinatior]|uniref:uncharacterized protein LOC105152775 n=1 Tax=Acromyrmex echinatior TaxID=103372 RepID=UPI000580E9E7|nr:PREDICTED: uncharacterized protein LOC105152775 [Acromyrmex echinatior]
MDFFDTRYFRINKFFLSFIGLWPYQTSFIKLLTQSFAIFGVTIMCAPQIAYMFKHVDDLDNMFELMPILAGTVICIAKIISLTCNSEMIIVRMGSSEIMRYVALMLMQSCRLFFNSWAGQEVTDHSVEVSIAAYDGIWYNASVKVQKLLLFLIARSQKASQITIAKLYVINLEGFIWMATFVIGFALLPLVNPLLDVLSPLNITRPKKFIYPAEMLVDHEKYYYILLTIMYYSYFVACVVTLAIDTIYFAFIEHACALFDILNYHLKNMVKGRSKQEAHHDSSSKQNNIVQHLIRCILLHIKIKAYNGAWYETSNTAKKMLLMLILRSQMISEIKVAKSFVMNLENFTVIAFLFKRMRRLNDFYDVLPTFLGTCICLLKTIGLQWQTEKRLCKERQFLLLVFTLTGAASFVTAPLTIPLLDSILMSNVTRTKRMPHPTEFFLDMEKYYYILLALTIVGYSVCCMVIVATDTIYLALLQHICGTLAILSYRLKRLATRDISKKCFDPTSKEDGDVENMIVTRTELVRNGPLVLIQSLRFFFNSWLGQKIIDHSSQISVAAFLTVIGQWPFQSRLESNMMFAITSLSTFSFIFFQFWGLAAGITDLSIIMENTSQILVNSMIAIKLINCVFTNDKMKVLLEDIKKTWKIEHTDAEKKILQHYAEKSRTFTIGYANHVLDIDKYFELLMLHGFISVFYLSSVPLAVDTTFTLCTHHICALFECLRYNIERIRGLDFVLLEPNIKDDEVYRDIIGCIKSYQHALKFFDVLSSNYATSFFFLLGNVIISLSFGALLMVDNQLEEIVRLLAVTLAQLLHIYFLSLISQRLIDHSSGLQNVIYSCDWYKISRRSKHLLSFTLLRSTKPCQLIAGNMFVMSMENFSSILKVSLSYFTMLTSLQ